MSVVTVAYSGVVVLEADKALSADFDSAIADFKNMAFGSVQAYWSGQDADDGTFQLYVSNLLILESFVPLDGAIFSMKPGCQSHIFLLTDMIIGFRYAFVRYRKNSVGAGSVKLVAIGKRTGGLN